MFFVILTGCQKNKKNDEPKVDKEVYNTKDEPEADEEVFTMNQITTNYDTLINRVKNKGDIDSYDEMFYSFMDANETERTDSVMKYSKVMAEKYNYDKAYLDYFVALCEKNNIKVDYSNYSTIDITSLEEKSKVEAIKWLNLMRNRKIISPENYNAIKK